MSRFCLLQSRVLGAALLALGALACGEDGKTAPERCADPPLPIYDIQDAGAHAVDNPCVTPIGHAVTEGGSSSSGGSGGTNSTSGPGLGGSPADAGAGGA